MAQTQIQRSGNLYVTGASTLTAGNNLLNTVAGTAAIDITTLSQNAGFRSMLVQFSGNVTPTSGAIAFEGSNDNVNFSPIYGTEVAYEWTGMEYNSFSYPIATGVVSRSFELPIKFRYIRARISTVMGGVSTFTANITYSQTEYTQRTPGIPSSNFINSFNFSSAAGGAMNAPASGNGLKQYFIGASHANGAGGASAGDFWISQGGSSTPPHAGVTQWTSTKESDVFYSPYPVPTNATNAFWGIYTNGGGSNNNWGTIWYFNAP